MFKDDGNGDDDHDADDDDGRARAGDIHWPFCYDGDGIVWCSNETNKKYTQ